ncbi:MAG: Brp/Blh family beta-carotene 15,15'-dioxygenase [Planctomycetia bacterium]
MDSLLFRVVPLGCLLAAAIVSLWCGPGWTTRMGAVPWLIAIVFVGLPHGAADLAVSWRLCGKSATLRLFTIYTALMAVVLLAFVIGPRTVLVLFGALSIWHFGLSHALGQVPAPTPTWGGLVLAAVARGAGVLGVPLAAWPAETAALVAEVIGLVAHDGGAHAVPFSTATIRAAGICLTGAAVVAFTVETLATRRIPGAVRRSADTLVDLLVIALLGATADPLFSVGLYFLCWHAWREMRPLTAVLAKPAGCAVFSRDVVAVHVAALPLLIPTWIALLASWWFLSPGQSAHDLAVLSLVAYLVVTPSHEALGNFLRPASAGRDAPAGARAWWANLLPRTMIRSADAAAASFAAISAYYRRHTNHDGRSRSHHGRHQVAARRLPPRP